MSDRQYKAQLRRLRRGKEKAKQKTSTGGSGKKKKKSGLKHQFSDSNAEKRKELLRGKL